MTRKRHRSRGGRSWLIPFILGLVLVVVIGTSGVGFKSVAYSSSSAPRTSTADVVVDESGVHALDTTQAVQINSTEALVNVTNHHTREVSVTVSLRDDSTHLGDLVLDGSSVGNSATFSLTNTATQRVEIQVPDDSSLDGETVYFHVNASTTSYSVSATDRSAPVEA